METGIIDICLKGDIKHDCVMVQSMDLELTSLPGFTSQLQHFFSYVILNKNLFVILSIKWVNSCKAWHMPDNVCYY